MKKLSKTTIITEERLYEILRDTLNDFSGSIGKRFDGMDSRFDGIDTRLDGIDNRIDGVENRLDGKIDSLKNDMYTKFDMVVKRLDDIDANLVIQGHHTDKQTFTLENH